MSPQRIQLRRTKGWRKPEGAIVVSRPSKWGNPFQIERHDCTMGGFCWRVFDDRQVWRDHLDNEHIARLHATELFELHTGPMGNYEFDSVAEVKAALGGHDLACWCPLDGFCHADVLLDVANS